jgi:hypothetical protein
LTKGVPPATCDKDCYSRRKEIPQQIVRRQTILKHRKKAMITQEKEIADPQLRQELDALVKEFDEAKNNNDAVAALFTDDAILVTDSGPIYIQT